MRIGFVTCVKLGLSCMETIYEAGGLLDVIFTLKDKLATRKSGRVYLDDFSRRHGIELVKFGNMNRPKAVEAIKAADLDWLFIIGWSQIAQPPVLRSLKRGAIGIHPTLLPVGRGRAAIPWAILKGLRETGVTLFQLDEGVDTGPILGQVRIPLHPRETATTLYEKVNEAHKTLIADIWDDLAGNRLQPIAQDESKATFWPGRKPEDGRISPDTETAYVERLVRAVTRPYPGAFFDNGGRRLRIWDGCIGDANSAPRQNVLRLNLVDGIYDVLDYDWEVIPDK